MNTQDNRPRHWINIPSTLFLTILLGISPQYANSADSATEILNLTYPIVDTGQVDCYNNTTTMDVPVFGETFYGQDAQHVGHQADYIPSDDGLTVYDNVTGLTWTQSPDLDGDGDIDIDDKLTFDEAQEYPDILNAEQFGGYNDWRIPTIKELYSLMDFTGQTRMSAAASVPYINTDYFAFGYGDETAGERFIDAQFCTSSVYISTIMNDQTGMFGVNFADGRIKCYPIGTNHGFQKTFYALFVRGNTNYGINDFTDNGDGTVTDNATGLMWTQDDTGQGMNWQDALAQVVSLNEQNYLGYADWRLPNAKELQGLLDYSRSPDTTDSAAIDPNFNSTAIIDEGGTVDYPFYWTNTTHEDGPDDSYAVYVCFGEALGWMSDPFGNNYTLMDVHGAGAQRSDPKSGDPADYPYGHGPQGDVIRIYNYVRCVRDVQATDGTATTVTTTEADPNLPADGYTLFAPLSSTTTYLIDNDGNPVHTWEGLGQPGNSVYLLDNGDLLRTEAASSTVFNTGGIGGSVSRYTWDNELLWTISYDGDTFHVHHDVEYLPNGHVLMIAWELKSSEEALAAGADPDHIPNGGLWPDHLIEVDPDAGDIVWQWHVWDHLVQDVDPDKPNFGVVSAHPERIDLNYRNRQNNSDWLHTNAVDYNPDLDQIMLSIHNFSEIWIIDHSTSTEEAAGQSGGLFGKGGDLLYRWGNPQVYGAGTDDDQQLFSQHDAKWIETGLPGAGNILVFNNGDRFQRPWSTVVEIVPPLNTQGTYDLMAGESFGPAAPVWEYQADPAENFFAMNISGAQRLANGNTLICDGPAGVFFEVKIDGTPVWEYVNSYTTQTPQGEQASVFRAERYSLDIIP